MITASVAWRSLRVVAIGSVASYVAVRAWPELADAVKTIAQGLFWSVPFVLATSLATFNNTLRIFDRIEAVVEGGLTGLTSHECDCLKRAIKSTETLTASLLVNSSIVIVAGIAYFVIGAFLSVPVPKWLVALSQVVRPTMVAVSVQFGLGLLTAWILVVQFRTIPPMVSFYKFFAIDRHLPPDATDGRTTDEVEGSGESASEA